jgi:hypothetical protein
MTQGFTGVATREPSFDKITMNGPIYRSNSTGLTALAGGGQTGATLLTGSICRVSTVATAADSVILPNAFAGREHHVINAGANSMNVFPAVGETINALSANTAFAVAAGKTCSFFSPADGAWYANLSA